MRVIPKKYNKQEFIEFLEKNNVNSIIINKFAELPEVVEYRGSRYEIYITSIWYDINKTRYNFELNYYSENLIEYLFNSKVFDDVELSINNLSYELTNAKLVNYCK